MFEKHSFFFFKNPRQKLIAGDFFLLCVEITNFTKATFLAAQKLLSGLVLLIVHPK